MLLDYRKKLTIRITELEEIAERERTRATNADKIKSKLQSDVKDLSDEVERCNAANVELLRKVIDDFIH